MLKAVIFDLNGIFILSPKLSDRFAQTYKIPVEQFIPALQDVLSKARQENAGHSFVYWQEYLKRWNLPLSEKEFFDFWFKVEKPNPDMIALAQELKNRGLKLFILSNNFAERADYYQEYFSFLAEIFDQVYYSWQTGLVKPDPAAYQQILSDHNLSPEECVYFDDSEKNIQAAKALGIKSYLFTGPEQVRKILQSVEY